MATGKRWGGPWSIQFVAAWFTARADIFRHHCMPLFCLMQRRHHKWSTASSVGADFFVDFTGKLLVPKLSWLNCLIIQSNNAINNSQDRHVDSEQLCIYSWPFYLNSAKLIWGFICFINVGTEFGTISGKSTPKLTS